MNKPIILSTLIVFVALNGWAEEKNSFDLGPVDFFGKDFYLIPKDSFAASQDETNAKNQDVSSSDSSDLWVEPMISKDGKITMYTPPKEVKDFLDNPTEETGKNYLDWSLKRLEKLKKAETILQKLNQDLVNNKFNYRETYASEILTKDIQYMAFFLIKGCPYCAQQIGNIIKLKEQRPEIKIDVYVRNYTQDDIVTLPFPAKPDNNMSISLGFNKYPTTLVSDKDGKRALIAGILSLEMMADLTHKVN